MGEISKYLKENQIKIKGALIPRQLSIYDIPKQEIPLKSEIEKDMQIKGQMNISDYKINRK